MAEKKWREDGFYWVYLTDEWQVAEWRSDMESWLVTGMDIPFNERDFVKIGPKLEPPE